MPHPGIPKGSRSSLLLGGRPVAVGERDHPALGLSGGRDGPLNTLPQDGAYLPVVDVLDVVRLFYPLLLLIWF